MQQADILWVIILMKEINNAAQNVHKTESHIQAKVIAHLSSNTIGYQQPTSN